MYHYRLLLWLLLSLACRESGNRVDSTNSNPDTLQQSVYKWRKVLDSAEWPRSYNFQMINIRDTLWVLQSTGNWYSADGSTWKKSSLENVIGNGAFLKYVYFRNSLFGLGHFEGNIEQFKFHPQVFKTGNMVTWDTLAMNSNLPARFFYEPVVFRNRIWIIGGEDLSGQYDEIWTSADAVKWTKEPVRPAFGKRGRTRLVRFHDKLFLLDNDVWSSMDGLAWKQETPAILPNETVFGYEAVIFDDKIWLLGCNRDGRFSSQVLVSADGKTWTPQDAPWSPRGAVASAIFKGRVYMTGGKYGGIAKDGTTTEFVYSNDLWVLEKLPR